MMKTHAPWLPLALLVALAGSAAPADEPRFVDGEPLALEPQPVRRRQIDREGNRAWLAFRFEAFGAASLTLRVHADGAETFLRVEGPLTEKGAEEAPGAAEKLTQSGEAKVVVRLPRAGVYRILVAGADGSTKLEADCTGACARPTLSLGGLLVALDAGERKKLTESIEQFLATRVADRGARERIAGEWRRLLERLTALDNVPDRALDRALERFPTLPALREMLPYRTLMSAFGTQEPTAAVPEVLRTKLGAYLGALELDGRVRPKAINPALPRLGYGHFRSRALPVASQRDSIGLAGLLTTLALDNGSRVETPAPQPRTVRSPKAFLRWLLATGHDVEMLAERTYANFLSLTWDDSSVQWPVWLDTGLTLSDRSRLHVPVGHSQFAWYVRGPVVNGRVAFFIGVDGSGFFPLTTVRPAWTGNRVTETVTSATDAGRRRLLDTIDWASKYLRRVRLEATTVAKGYRAGGYGYLGICNDSTAVLEAAAERPITVYPLVRASELLKSSTGTDGLDPLFTALASRNDAEGNPEEEAYRRDALCRALHMSPFPVDSPRLLDDRLRAQLRRARTDVGEACTIPRDR